jgi:hypothetical protein
MQSLDEIMELLNGLPPGLVIVEAGVDDELIRSIEGVKPPQSLPGHKGNTSNKHP